MSLLCLGRTVRCHHWSVVSTTCDSRLFTAPTKRPAFICVLSVGMSFPWTCSCHLPHFTLRCLQLSHALEPPGTFTILCAALVHSLSACRHVNETPYLSIYRRAEVHSHFSRNAGSMAMPTGWRLCSDRHKFLLVLEAHGISKKRQGWQQMSRPLMIER